MPLTQLETKQKHTKNPKAAVCKATPYYTCILDQP